MTGVACVVDMEEQTGEKTEHPSKSDALECAEKKDEIGTKESVSNGADETGDPFKKPALFAAPRLANRKAGAAVPSAAGKPPQEVSDKVQEKALQSDVDFADSCGDSSSAVEDVTTRQEDTGAQTPEKEVKLDRNQKSVQPANASQKVKQVFPSKPPSDGRFKHAPPLPYTEPPWGGLAETPYSFEILKNGAIVDTVPLTQQSFFVIGRLPVCDVSLEHPSISRYHAVVQYRRHPGELGPVGEEAGFYTFDLGSTHGTFINKNKIPPKTYIRLRVGHVLKFGGSTRLFILQGPESDEEVESELTVTELRERARKQREELEKRMMGNCSDEEDEEKGEKESSSKTDGPSEEAGCSWGMGEEALPEEEENEENPFAMEFQEDQEAAYLKDPKKALQGFYDREGEELEYEFEDRGHGTWTCRVKLPVDDALGRQLVAEVTHSGKKKEAAVQCALDACRMLEARGLLRQEAVSRKRKKKNWEEEDFYDSDDDTFLDRTGVVERKRRERMRRAGKIEERPDTYDSLVEKLAAVEKELGETDTRLSASAKGGAGSSSDDSLEAFMSEVRSQGALDSVERRKLHVRAAELRDEVKRLRRLVELTRPALLPPLYSGPGEGSAQQEKSKKPSLPLFGAMKGGSKFKLRTGTIGKVPPKRTNLPPELFNMKELPLREEEEEEEEQGQKEPSSEQLSKAEEGRSPDPHCVAMAQTGKREQEQLGAEEGPVSERRQEGEEQSAVCAEADKGSTRDIATQPSLKKKDRKKACGPSRPPVTLSAQYPEDDPDYCVWMPPAGQCGDGRTHLNEKYGY